MAEPFTGQISIFGFNFAPLNWAACQGQIVPISQYTALFSLLGTMYGGNGTTNFGLPNLQGTVGVGQGQLAGGQNYDLGERGGSTGVALSRPEAPPHTHSLMATLKVAAVSDPTGAVLARPEVSGSPKATMGNIYNANVPDTTLSAPISPIGNGEQHDNTQPFLVLNYCICLSGVFPSRP
jgi:microcystin-dependent protein